MTAAALFEFESGDAITGYSIGLFSMPIGVLLGGGRCFFSFPPAAAISTCNGV
jgi:hypothetical protein